MIIDDKSFPVPNTNYIESETIKKQIVIGHTGFHGMNHHQKWLHRLNGKYTKSAPFSIDLVGNIYKHYDPINSSTILGNIDTDKKSIVILLENEGGLIKDGEKNQFINWIGHIYNNPEDVVIKKWRGYLYWASYTKEQVDSLLDLVNGLCDEFFIPKTAISHNTFVDINELIDFRGILYRSNLEKHYTDLSPAWNCEFFKYKLENNDKQE